MGRGSRVAAVSLCALLGCGGPAPADPVSPTHAVAPTAASGIPVSVELVPDEADASPASADLTRDVPPMVQARPEERERVAKEYAAEQLALCRKAVDAAHAPAKPGKRKLKGTYTCVYSGGFIGTAIVQISQVKNGAITATVSETGGGAVTNTAWGGVIIGNELRFAYRGVDAGGALLIEDHGREMSGTGTSLTDAGCVTWNMSCTR